MPRISDKYANRKEDLPWSMYGNII